MRGEKDEKEERRGGILNIEHRPGSCISLKREMILISANDTNAEDVNHFRARYGLRLRLFLVYEAENKTPPRQIERLAFNKIGIDLRVVGY